MNICAIVCEFNPLHDGHLFLLERARQLSGADTILCLMSGNFVQRGEPAVCDKYLRAKLAIAGGADIVLELPTAYALGSAEMFAFQSVRMLTAFPKVESLCFGSEGGNLAVLERTRDLLILEPTEFKTKLNEMLDKGESYTKSYAEALRTMSKDADLLLRPNNTLAIEYLKALKKLNSSIRPIAVNRVGSGYDEEEISEGFPSATAIRNALKKGDFNTIKNSQKNTLINELIERIIANPVYDSRLDSLALYKCRSMTSEALNAVYGANEGIGNAIKAKCEKFGSIFDAQNALVSKRYKRTSIARIFCNTLLGITKERVLNFLDSPPYFNILALKKERDDLLRNLPSSCILSFADLNNIIDPRSLDLLAIDQTAALVYEVLTGAEKAPFIRQLQKV